MQEWAEPKMTDRFSNLDPELLKMLDGGLGASKRARKKKESPAPREEEASASTVTVEVDGKVRRGRGHSAKNRLPELRDDERSFTVRVDTPVPVKVERQQPLPHFKVHAFLGEKSTLRSIQREEEAKDEDTFVPPQFRRNWTREELRANAGRTYDEMSDIDRATFLNSFPHALLWDHREMDEEERRVYLTNPHIRQVFASFRMLEVVEEKVSESDRVFTADSPRAPYRRRKGEWKTVESCEARKELVMHIEFLVNNAEVCSAVVWVGGNTSALAFIASLFPAHTFYAFGCEEREVEKGENVVVVSSVVDPSEMRRSMQERTQSEKVMLVVAQELPQGNSRMVEQARQALMFNQERWVKQMKPVTAFLKLQLPYTPGTTEYFEGTLYAPIWGGRTASQCALVLNVLEDVDEERKGCSYSNEDYEQLMYAHNTLVRTRFYPQEDHILSLPVGYDHCYDCGAEVVVLSRYLEKLDLISQRSEVPYGSIQELAEQICKLSLNDMREMLHSKSDIFFDNDLRRLAKLPLLNVEAQEGELGKRTRDQDEEEAAESKLGSEEECDASHDSKRRKVGDGSSPEPSDEEVE